MMIRPNASFFKEHNSRLQTTRFALAESICRVFNVFNLYRKSPLQFDALLARLH